MGSHARLLLSFLLTVVVPLSARSQALVHDWGRGFGGVGYQYGISVAVDGVGNVVMVGSYEGTIDLGGGPLTSAGDYDLFIAKFDAAGNHMWSQRFGDAGMQLAKDVAVGTGDGSIVFAGIFQSSVDFGGGPLVSSGGFDAYLVKFDASGNYDWSRRFGETGDQTAYGVAVDVDGNIALTGHFASKVDFGGGMHTSAGANDAYVASFDRNGNARWSAQFGDAASQSGFSVAVDADGSIVVTGLFSGSMDFGGGAITSAGGTDIFVAKLDIWSAHVWSRAFGDASDQNGNSVAVDNVGNILVAGDFEGEVDFGGGSLTSAGWFDAFLVKFDDFGNHVWSQGFGDVDGQFSGGVAVDDQDNVVLAGYFEGTMNLGGGPLLCNGFTDAYVARFDPLGGHLWSDGFGDAGNQYGIACATDAAGSVLMLGYFEGAIDFGGGTITSGGVEDAYLVKFSAPEPDIQMIVDVPGDQGGWARLYLTRALSDEVGASPYPVLNYHIFRRVDNPALAARVSSEGYQAGASLEFPAMLGGAPLISLDGRSFWRAPASSMKDEVLSSASLSPNFVLWEAVATVPARQQPFYIGLVPTLADSMAAIQYSVYFVMAQTTTPWVFYDSAPDSGYSVDNLSPATPQGLAGTPVVSPAALTLAWDANTENDLSHYAVYRGTTIGFVPAPGNRVAEPAAPGFVDDQWQWNSGYYYKVAAADVHGNESGYALLTPEQVTGIGGDGPPLASFLSQNHPNPFSATTSISFGLTDGADVRIRIYDVEGRVVRKLVDGHYAADRHEVNWDGRNDAGLAVAGGVYFYRIDGGAFVQTRKLLLMR